MSIAFKFYDVSRFPLVTIEGSRLPPGYAPQWIAEMDALVARATPFAFILLDGVENPAHADQKAQTHWFKRNKKALASVCRGVVAVEPDRAKRRGGRKRARLLLAGEMLSMDVPRLCRLRRRLLVWRGRLRSGSRMSGAPSPTPGVRHAGGARTA